MTTTQIIAAIHDQADFKSNLTGVVKIDSLINFQLAIENCELDDINGFVWLDENADAIFNINETGIENILITLTLPDEFIMTTSTDSTGYYEFENLHVGEYNITVDTIENLNLITAAEYQVNIPLPNDENYNFGFVQVDTFCDNTAILNEFPWLNNLINFNNCAGISINFYNFGAYQFLEIIGDGNNKLYFQDGTLYCEDYGEFSCADAYCFNIEATSWDCCETDSNDDESNFEDCQAISDYPWIADIIDIENCENGFIKVYDFNEYAFISISDGNNSELYLNDGRLWCADGLELNCVNAYGLTESQISVECSCNNSDPGNLEGIFEQYPWILTWVNPENCSNEQISEYEYFDHNYLYIETDECNALYRDDGIIYCIDSENFSCLNFYGLTNTINYWSCTSDKTVNNETISNIDFNIVPNPNNGYFEILIPASKKGNYLINIYNVNGAIIKTIAAEESDSSKQIAVNLQDAATGIYYVEIIVNNFEKTTKKVIKY